MMQWTLASPTMLRTTFRYDKRVVERIKQLDGAQWDKQQRCWFVPVTQVERAVELFPLAQFDYDVIALAVDMPRRRAETFIRNMERLGITLYLDDEGGVDAEGAGITPALLEALEERAPWLRPHIGAQNGEKGATGYKPTRDAQSRHTDGGNPYQRGGCSTSSDEREERITQATLTGIKNAVVAEERKRQIVRGYRRRKNDDLVQLGLGL